MSDVVLDAGPSGSRRKRTAQSADRVRSPTRIGIVVVVLGLVITLACSWIALVLNRNNEHRLLQLQTIQAGAVLSATIANIETPLVTSAQLAAHTSGDPTVFETYLAPNVGSGKVFAHVSLWKTSDPSSPPVEVASVGTPAIDPDSRARMLALAPTAPTAVVRGISTTTLQRIAYAVSGGAGTGYVVYAERPIPASRQVPVEKGSAFADLEFATYVGRDTSTADLATTDVPLADLPLSGDTDRVVLPFGDSWLTLDTAPQGQLGGTLGAALPWIFLIAGVAITAAIAVVSVRLRRRHALAEEDARTIAQLYDRLDTLYDEQRSIADSLQRALLPRKNPDIPDLEVASRFVAGADRVSVGGDWYSVIGTGGTRFAFVVGDVSGRGISAATTMAHLRFTIRAYLLEGHPPDRALELAARQITVAEEGHMATVLVGVGDAATGTVTLANAGHLPPVLRSPAGARLVEVAVDPPLGVGACAYSAQSITVAPGETLLLYTDGLVERRGELLDVGLGRLVDAASTQGDDLEVFVDTLIGRLTGPESTDDIAVLALRRTAGARAGPVTADRGPVRASTRDEVPPALK